MFKFLALLFAISAAPMAWANSPVAVEAGDFAAQRATIVEALADGKTYAEISQDDRSKVVASLERMAALLEGGKSAQSLTPPQKIDLFNEQEIVNTVLTRAAADSRVTCVPTRVTGTHRRSAVCTTAAERERRRNRDQEVLQNSQRVIPIAHPNAAPSSGN